MNSNLIHNVLNIAALLLTGLTAILMKVGCTQTATGDLDCSGSTIPPQYAMYVVFGIMVLKLVINIGRDGFSGLVKPQPPVQK